MSAAPHIVPLSSRALVRISGPDWRSFLQGLLSQDVDTLAAGEIRFGALLTPQGRLLYDLFLIGDDDGCRLDVERATRDALIQRLSMYRLRAKVVVEADEAPVAAAIGEQPPGGWLQDPRLPALGWRGYGVTAHGDEAEYDRHRLALGVPGPADWAGKAVGSDTPPGC